ncbi:MAG: nucleotidyltransferase domain-containing protein [Synergistota bacterium]|nr:nucleotidyltransferase domain-containing protein [Synergistota bacterium]
MVHTAGRALEQIKTLGVDCWALSEAKKIALDSVKDLPVKVFLFGSRARGNNRPFSDIDIALEHENGALSPALLALLRERFEESLIPFMVDLVDLGVASEVFNNAVKEEAIQWTS